jgi:hypothetical protein
MFVSVEGAGRLLDVALGCETVAEGPLGLDSLAEVAEVAEVTEVAEPMLASGVTHTRVPRSHTNPVAHAPDAVHCFPDNSAESSDVLPHPAIKPQNRKKDVPTRAEEAAFTPYLGTAADTGIRSRNSEPVRWGQTAERGAAFW